MQNQGIHQAGAFELHQQKKHLVIHLSLFFFHIASVPLQFLELLQQ